MLRDRFLEAMSQAASTVNVVTTDGPRGRAGVTVSAMCSVSADPPSLLVCVHHQSRAGEAIRENGVLCVNVLRDDHVLVSDTFAGRRDVEGADKFDCADWMTRATGAPTMKDALAAFDCRIKHHFRWGSHFIFVAEVEAITLSEHGSPLIYANRAYGVPARLRDFLTPVSPATDTGSRASLRVGCFRTFAPFVIPALMRASKAEGGEVSLELEEGEQEDLLRGLSSGSLDLALMYDFELGGELEATLLAEGAPYALLPAGHPLAEKPALSLRDLAPQPMVLLDISPSRGYFTSIFAQVGLVPNIAYRSPSFETVRSMVASGFGYSVLVTKPANGTSYVGEALSVRTLNDPVTPGRIVLARRRGSETPVCDRFLARCRDRFGGVYAH